MRNGDAILVMVKDGRVIHHSWNMSLPHVEFVKRATGQLPDGAWLEQFRNRTARLWRSPRSVSLKNYQLPAPADADKPVREMFE